MGDKMIDYWANLIKCEDNDVRVNLRPKVYDKNNNNNQSTNLQDGHEINILPPFCNKFQIGTCYRISIL